MKDGSEDGLLCGPHKLPPYGNLDPPNLTTCLSGLFTSIHSDGAGIDLRTDP